MIMVMMLFTVTMVKSVGVVFSLLLLLLLLLSTIKFSAIGVYPLCQYNNMWFLRRVMTTITVKTVQAFL